MDGSPAPHSAERALSVVGAGAVGEALTRSLLAAGARVRLWNRTVEHARAVAIRLRDEGAWDDAAWCGMGGPGEGGGEPRLTVGALDDFPGEDADRVERVVLCVSESALPALSVRLAGAWKRNADAGAVALHTAGALGPEVLAPLREAGVAIGRMHPLAALRAGAAVPAGTWFGVAGDATARVVAAELVTALSGRSLELDDDAALSVHLAANLVAGGAVALVDLALELVGAAAPAADTRQALAALLASAAENLAVADPSDALTGPQARGGVDVVRAHLESLAHGEAPAAERVYRELALRMVSMARRRAAVAPEALDALERLLGPA